MELIETTRRANYWRTAEGLFRSSKPGEPAPSENGAGYVSLDALKKLKGEPLRPWFER
jgi:hypothetical protein